MKSSFPDFVALRAAAEEVYQSVLNLTSKKQFNIFGGMYRLVVTRDGHVSFTLLSRDDVASKYPPMPRTHPRLT